MANVVIGKEYVDDDGRVCVPTRLGSVVGLGPTVQGTITEGSTRGTGVYKGRVRDFLRAFGEVEDDE